MNHPESLFKTSTGKERLFLSGSVVSPQFINGMKEISGMKRPHVVIDTSGKAKPDNFKQTAKTYDGFLERMGLSLPEYLQVESGVHSPDTMHKMIDEADVLFTHGGSTQRIYDRWHAAGIADHIKERVLSGDLAASGGSAGTMIWFENGFSDSIQEEVPEGAHWNYIKSDGLGVLPYIVTAHLSDVDEHSRPRDIGYRDFLLREAESNEKLEALGIDAFAAFVAIDGVSRVVSLAKELKDPKYYYNDAAIHHYTYTNGSLVQSPLYDIGDN